MLVEDYLSGIADLTGELMRYAINCVGKGDHGRALQVCQFLRNLNNGDKNSQLKLYYYYFII